MFPVDVSLLRKDPEKFKEAFRKRFMEVGEKLVDRALELDEKRRSIQKELDSLRSNLNKLSKAVGIIKSYSSGKISREDALNRLSSFLSEPEKYLNEDGEKLLREKIFEIKRRISELEQEFKKVTQELVDTLWKFPNFVDEEVPIGPDDSYNVPIRFWGIPRVWKGHLNSFKEQTEKYGFKIVELREFFTDSYQKYVKDLEKLKIVYESLKGDEDFREINFNEVLDFDELNKDKIVPYVLIEWEPKHHYDLVKEFDLADTDKAGEVAGSRFYFEKGLLTLMDLGLAIEGIKFLMQRGYFPCIPPYMLKGDILNGIITLDDFEDMMYKLEKGDLYLIGTAEHPLTALHFNDIFEVNTLPKKYVGWSPCFRREAGAHGKDTKGIFRVHQFHKVEQYIFCEPKDSEKYHQEIVRNAEEFMERLNLPYRTVIIASGDMGKRNYKQYDVEGWFPGQGKYRELVSGSNVTDWQSRRSNIRYRTKEGKLEYVHTLNCTLVAQQRTLCCILENYYDAKNNLIVVPRVLRSYTDIEKIINK